MLNIDARILQTFPKAGPHLQQKNNDQYDQSPWLADEGRDGKKHGWSFPALDFCFLGGGGCAALAAGSSSEKNDSSNVGTSELGSTISVGPPHHAHSIHIC